MSTGGFITQEAASDLILRSDSEAKERLLAGASNPTGMASCIAYMEKLRQIEVFCRSAAHVPCSPVQLTQIEEIVKKDRAFPENDKDAFLGRLVELNKDKMSTNKELLELLNEFMQLHIDYAVKNVQAPKKPPKETSGTTNAAALSEVTAGSGGSIEDEDKDEDKDEDEDESVFLSAPATNPIRDKKIAEMEGKFEQIEREIQANIVVLDPDWLDKFENTPVGDIQSVFVHQYAVLAERYALLENSPNKDEQYLEEMGKLYEAYDALNNDMAFEVSERQKVEQHAQAQANAQSTEIQQIDLKVAQLRVDRDAVKEQTRLNLSKLDPTKTNGLSMGDQYLLKLSELDAKFNIKIKSPTRDAAFVQELEVILDEFKQLHDEVLQNVKAYENKKAAEAQAQVQAKQDKIQTLEKVVKSVYGDSAIVNRHPDGGYIVGVDLENEASLHNALRSVKDGDKIKEVKGEKFYINPSEDQYDTLLVAMNNKFAEKNTRQDETIKAYMDVLVVDKNGKTVPDMVARNDDGSVTIKFHDVLIRKDGKFNEQWAPIMSDTKNAPFTFVRDERGYATIDIPKEKVAEFIAFIEKRAGNQLNIARYEEVFSGIENTQYDLTKVGDVQFQKERLDALMKEIEKSKKRGEIKADDLAALKSRYDQLVLPINIRLALDAIEKRERKSLSDIEKSDNDARVIGQSIIKYQQEGKLTDSTSCRFSTSSRPIKRKN